MKKTLGSLLLLICCISAISAEALAGPRVGNGGGTWVCFENQLGIRRWVTLVDLFEAKHEFNLRLEEAKPGDPWALLGKKLFRISSEIPALASQLTLGSLELRKLIRFVPRSSELTHIDDGMIRVRPSPNSCLNGTLFYAQAANFTDDGRLLIADDIWSDPAFSDNDRAGLLLHEIIYKSMREKKGDENSSRARRIVGLLFSDLPASVLNGLIAKILEEGSEPDLPPKDDKHKVTCEASLYFFPPAESAAPAVLEEAFGKLEAKIGRYVFTAQLKDNIPVSLEIFDTGTGARVILPEDTARAVFSRHRRVSTILESTKDQSVALLYCK